MRFRHAGQNMTSILHAASQAALRRLPTDLSSNHPHPLWMTRGLAGCRGRVKRARGSRTPGECAAGVAIRRQTEMRARVKRRSRPGARDWRRNHHRIREPSWCRARRLSTTLSSGDPHALWRTVALRETDARVNRIACPASPMCLFRPNPPAPGAQARATPANRAHACNADARPRGCASTPCPAPRSVPGMVIPRRQATSSPMTAQRSPRRIHFTCSSRKARMTPPISTPWVSSARWPVS